MQRNIPKYKPDMDEEGISIFERKLPAGNVCELHWHEYLEFEIIVSGKVRHVYNNHKYELSSGDAFLMCYCDLHEVTAMTDVLLYSVHFDSSILAPELTSLLDYNRFHCHLEDTEKVRILHLISCLQRESLGKQAFYRKLLKQYINEIMVLMLRKANISIDSTIPQPIQQMVSYLNEHFTEKISLTELADQLAMSTNYLGQLFKQQFGCTFHEYLNLQRLKQACRLLDSTELSVKEIGFMIGYQSTEYFLYVFRNHMQTTPTEYRRRHAEKVR